MKTSEKEILAAMPSDNPVKWELDLDEPPEEVIEYAEKELGEDPDTRCQILEELKDRIYDKGECTPHRMDDAFLLRFLRARNFVVRHAHRLLVNYCEFRENNPELFQNVDLKNLKKVGDEILTVLPYREQTGRRILLYKTGLWDPEKISLDELFQATLISLELAIAEQRAQILGGVCVFDLEGITMQHILYLTPTVAKKMFDIMVRCFPLRIHAIHVVKQPWIFEIAHNLFKPFMTEQMRERIFIHSDNMESLHEHIEPKYLPERYGGIHPDYDNDKWVEYFKGSEKIHWELESHGYKIIKKEDEDNKNEERND